MRKLPVVFFLCALTIPVWSSVFARPAKGYPYEPIRFFPVAKNLMEFRKCCPSPLGCPAFTGTCMLRRNRAVVNELTFTYTGIPFHRGAVFCRMENHFLLKYNVKFSIHAGGYRE